MDFGKFRHVIAIEEVIETRNETGEFLQEWKCFATTRARIESNSYTQQTMMDQTIPTASWSCTSRWIEGIRGKMRVRWISNCDRILHISSMREIGHKQFINLILEERPENA